VPGAVLADNAKVDATVTTTDDAGNSATADANRPYGVDTEIEATITIDTIAGDDVINAEEAGKDIAVSGTVGGDVKVGDTVTVTVGGQTYTTTVQTGNTWTVDVPGAVLADNAKVDAAGTNVGDAGRGATVDANRPYGVDTEIEATITIDTIAGDDVINAEEAGKDIAVSGTVGGDVRDVHSFPTRRSSDLYTTTVQTGNTWTVDVPGAVLADNAKV